MLEIEEFVVLAVNTRRSVMSRACEILEEQGVPVILEHVEVEDSHSGHRTPGFRLMVPTKVRERSVKLLNEALLALPDQSQPLAVYPAVHN